LANSLVATLKNSFVRDTFALSSSTAIAQLIALATVPVLARVFSPELEHTVVLPENDEDADAIVAGLFTLALLVSFLTAGLIFVAGEPLAAGLLGQPQLARWLPLVSISGRADHWLCGSVGLFVVVALFIGKPAAKPFVVPAI